MLRPREGCEVKHTPGEGRDKGIELCWPANAKDGQIGKRYADQPIVTWNIAIAISLVEA